MKKIFVLLCVVLAVWSCSNAPEKPSASLNSEVQQLRDEVADLKQQLKEKNDDDDNTDADADDSAPMDDSTPEDAAISFPTALEGTIGGYVDCVMTLHHGEGTVQLGDGERIISFNSYNHHNGQLVLDAYYTDGRYIGQYVGTYRRSGGGSYSGVFYNKKGSTVNFSLYGY